MHRLTSTIVAVQCNLIHLCIYSYSSLLLKSRFRHFRSLTDNHLNPSWRQHFHIDGRMPAFPTKLLREDNSQLDTSIGDSCIGNKVKLLVCKFSSLIDYMFLSEGSKQKMIEWECG